MKTGRTIVELAQEVARQAKTKKDFIATTGSAIEPVLARGGEVALQVGDKGVFPLNQLAHEQVGDHTNIPRKYYERMRTEAPGLLINNIQTWFDKYPAVRMVRTLDKNARAFLSNGFRAMDNYDFANAVLPILSKRKLEVMSCEVTDRKLYIKAVDEKLFRDVPVGFKMGDGSHRIFDTVAPAIILSNSEVGCGRLVVETGVYTRACTNMALFANSGMKRTHIGAKHKLLEEVEDLDSILSDQAKSKTNEALWLQVRDIVASAFDQKVVEKRAEQFAAASQEKIKGKVDKVVEVVCDKLGLSEQEGDDVLKFLIEGGQLSQYGIHSAITRAAQEVESYDRATELEYIGGKVVELAPAEWATLQKA